MKLSRIFFNQSTLRVARQLLGAFLVRKIGHRKIVGQIVETEAYIGFKDQASHASRGKTLRTAVMFGPPGFAYVYMIYGTYHCLNIVTGREHYPAAVLVRAVEPVSRSGIKPSGPGKVCQFFRIDKRINGADMYGQDIWIEDRKLSVPSRNIVRAKRIGVDYAGSYRHKLWRFYIRENGFVSRQ